MPACRRRPARRPITISSAGCAPISSPASSWSGRSTSPINLTWWFINWVDDAMRPFIPVSLRTETYLPFRVPGYGLIIALVALTLLGFLTAGFVGRTFVEFGENLLNRMPIVRPIYKTMKQIFETLFSKSGSSFGKVALAEFPTGMWSVVFVASPPSADMAAHLPGDEYVSCFLPCTPNPTTGFFFYAPRDQVIELDITVEQAMTLIMSAGMAQPNRRRAEEAGGAGRERPRRPHANARDTADRGGSLGPWMPPSMPASADDTFRQAVAAFQAGRLGDAEQHFKAVLRLQPENIAALNILAIVLRRPAKICRGREILRDRAAAESQFGCDALQFRHCSKGAGKANRSAETFQRGVEYQSGAPRKPGTTAGRHSTTSRIMTAHSGISTKRSSAIRAMRRLSATRPDRSERSCATTKLWRRSTGRLRSDPISTTRGSAEPASAQSSNATTKRCRLMTKCSR